MNETPTHLFNICIKYESECVCVCGLGLSINMNKLDIFIKSNLFRHLVCIHHLKYPNMFSFVIFYPRPDATATAANKQIPQIDEFSYIRFIVIVFVVPFLQT